MLVDLQYMSYGYAGDDTALEQTIFVNIQAINRSDTPYDNVRFGIFSDMDIGCASDGFAGCDSTRSLFFAYNWSDFDPTCIFPGYGDQPPAQGIKFLNQYMSSHRLWHREGPPYPQEDYIDGTYLGEPFTVLGYPTHFELPGGAWQENQPTPNMPDRAAVGAAGPFNFAPGDTLCFDLAFIFARASSGGAYASVEALKLRADSIQDFYDANSIACEGFPLMTRINEIEVLNTVRLYPNPANANITLEAPDA